MCEPLLHFEVVDTVLTRIYRSPSCHVLPYLNSEMLTLIQTLETIVFYIIIMERHILGNHPNF